MSHKNIYSVDENLLIHNLAARDREIERLTRERDEYAEGAFKRDAQSALDLIMITGLRAALEDIADERWTRDAIGYRRLAREALEVIS